MIYWDTSVILKLYAPEENSEKWQDLATRQERPLVSSALLLSEMAFALRRKEFRGEIKRHGAGGLYRLFRDDVEAGRIDIFPLGSDVLDECASLATGATGKGPATLRTLDGLHLATARLLKCRNVATADRRMREAANGLGIAAVGFD